MAIDTSVWLQDPYLRGAQFRALERVATSGALKLHLPAIVEIEVKAHIKEDCSESMELDFDEIQKEQLSEEDLTAIIQDSFAIIDSEFQIHLAESNDSY